MAFSCKLCRLHDRCWDSGLAPSVRQTHIMQKQNFWIDLWEVESFSIWELFMKVHLSFAELFFFLRSTTNRVLKHGVTVENTVTVISF